MTKYELAKIIASKTELSIKQVESVLNVLPEALIEGLQVDGKIRIGNLGTFKKVITKERVANNPRTGEKIVVPPKTKVKFVPAKPLKERIS